MNPRSEEEYRALRATIRERGTTRVWVFVAGILVWAVSTIATLAIGLPPVAALVLLLILAATFEAVLALHIGVERIGRYLLVFYDDNWERAAGAFGKPAGAAAIDPLFTGPFLLAAILSVLPVAAATPVMQEYGAIALAEIAFAARLLIARATTARQRTIDTEEFA